MGHECCGNHSAEEAHHEEEAGGCCGGASRQGGGCCGGGGASAQEELTVLTLEEIEALPTERLIARFRRGIEWFDRRVFELSERQIDQAFLPDAGVGRWPVRVLIGHVADADLAAVHRMRRAVAEENPVFSDWDENAFVDANLYGNADGRYADNPEGDHARVMNALGGYLATLHTLRQWTGQWLAGLSEKQLARQGMHPVKGPMSVRRIVVLYTWHLEYHAAFLTRKLDLLVGLPAEAR